MRGKGVILAVLGIIGGLAVREPLSVQAEKYRYDSLNRLKEVIYEDGSSVVYEYDANGNILKIEVEQDDSSSGEAGKEGEDEKTPETEGDDKDEKTPETGEDDKDQKTPETEEDDEDDEETPETEELPFPEREKDRWSIIKELFEWGIERIGELIHLIESLYFWK